MERFPSSKSRGEPSANPTMHAFPSQLRPREESGEERKAVPIRPATANSATTAAQNTEIRDDFLYPAGEAKFNGISSNAGHGPKYMRTRSFTSIASWQIASASTYT